MDSIAHRLAGSMGGDRRLFGMVDIGVNLPIDLPVEKDFAGRLAMDGHAIEAFNAALTATPRDNYVHINAGAHQGAA